MGNTQNNVINNVINNDINNENNNTIYKSNAMRGDNDKTLFSKYTVGLINNESVKIELSVRLPISFSEWLKNSDYTFLCEKKTKKIFTLQSNNSTNIITEYVEPVKYEENTEEFMKTVNALNNTNLSLFDIIKNDLQYYLLFIEISA